MELYRFGTNRIPAVAAGLGLFLLLLIACGPHQPAGVPPALPQPIQPLEAAAPPFPQPAPTPLTSPPMAPAATPALPVPSAAEAGRRPAELTTTATPTPVPQTAALKLEVTSPRDNAVVNSQLITVAGLTSPDAVVSVNGRLVTPRPDGRFAADLLLPLAYNPLPIEVIATSIAGEQRWVVLAVVYIP